ncbi:apolipoprotein D-like [Ptychodera flava]|uniref:apolipoprotein D-like n=1 Tax=Ptychodera flava TaxID=63121 RepID=UPI00396A7628
MAFLYEVFVLTFVASLMGVQGINWGRCPYSVEQNFNMTAYLGTWYEIEKFPESSTHAQKCVQATYELGDAGHIRVTNVEIDIETGDATAIVGDAYAPIPHEQAKLLVQFSWGLLPDYYWVLRTDYNTFSVVYSCPYFMGISRAELAWISSRERTLDAVVLDSLVDLQDMGLNISYFQSTNQTGCDEGQVTKALLGL